MITLVYLIIVIALLVFVTTKYKLHAFLSLLLASLVIGFVSGLDSLTIISKVTEDLDAATGKALAVLAIGAGAMTVSHINDSYFWVVSQFSGMDTSTALRTLTIATLLQGVSGIIVIMILSWFLL